MNEYVKRDPPVLRDRKRYSLYNKAVGTSSLVFDFSKTIVGKRKDYDVWHIILNYPDDSGWGLACTVCHSRGIWNPQGSDIELKWLDEIPLKNLCESCRKDLGWSFGGASLCDSFSSIGVRAQPFGNHILIPQEDAGELLRDYRNRR